MNEGISMAALKCKTEQNSKNKQQFKQIKLK